MLSHSCFHRGHLDKLWANSGDTEAGKGRHSGLICLQILLAGANVRAVAAAKKLVYTGSCVLEEVDSWLKAIIESGLPVDHLLHAGQLT